MSYTKEYHGINKCRESVLDCLQWLGPERFKTVVYLIRTDHSLTFAQFQFGMSFGGIQGFPVKCLWERYRK